MPVRNDSGKLRQVAVGSDANLAALTLANRTPGRLRDRWDT